MLRIFADTMRTASRTEQNHEAPRDRENRERGLMWHLFHQRGGRS